ncbi:glycosyltransferase family 4 protein [Shewanella algae]|uniref:glycosyltransferase family 4 protein n=1 Tax=Shewanella algae TaxID=38313 RepID=UPI0011417B2E|nr:glycosyltransferase family 4 protein [Shewanella algae]
MNILLCRSDIKLAGPAKLMLESARVLKKDNVVIVSTGGGEFLKHFEGNKIEHFTTSELRIEERSFVNFFIAVKKTVELIKKYNIDVVHCFNAHAAVIALVSKAIVRKKVKVVNTVLGNGKERYLKYLPVKYIAVSSSVKDKLLNHGVKDSQVKVIYNSIIPKEKVISLDDLEHKLANKSLKKIRFVSIAMFTGKKGHERIIEYFINSNFSFDFELFFIGDGETRELCEQKVNEAGCSDKIRFVGKQDDVYTWLDDSDVFIHLPDMETFGMVLIEAMSRGLPVIASNVGGIPEVVSSDCGVLIDLDFSQHQFNETISFLKELDVYKTMAYRARERVDVMFTLEKLYQDYKELYLS